MTSAVRQNMLTVVNYTPYCGNISCVFGVPRTSFSGKQFVCRCGWQSQFESEFIAEYKQAQEALRHGPS